MGSLCGHGNIYVVVWRFCEYRILLFPILEGEMKQVIYKIAVLFFLVFGVNKIAQILFISYDWGDDVLRTKNLYYNANQAKYNTAIVGGSLSYRHINSTQFDSLNRAHGLETSTFNLGVDGNNHIKQVILMDRLLNQKNSNLKYIFFALSSDSYFEERNLHTKKFITWIDWKSMVYAIKVTMASDAPFKTRLTVSYQYVLSWVENQLNAGMGLHLVNYLNDERKSKALKPKALLELGENADGFKPYFYPEDVDSAALPYDDQLLVWSYRHFKRHPEMMDSIFQTYKEEYSNYQPGKGFVNQAMLDKYLSLIKKAEKKGIQIIVLLPARSRLSYDLFLPIYDALPEKNKISLGDIYKYPEFYTHEHTFNFYHMNVEGADLYTQAFAEEFLKLNGVDANFYPPLPEPKLDSVILNQ
jgi:hypothetical protein